MVEIFESKWNWSRITRRRVRWKRKPTQGKPVKCSTRITQRILWAEDFRRRKNAQQLVDKVCIKFFHVSLKVQSKPERINFSSSLKIVSEHLLGKGGGVEITTRSTPPPLSQQKSHDRQVVNVFEKHHPHLAMFIKQPGSTIYGFRFLTAF